MVKQLTRPFIIAIFAACILLAAFVFLLQSVVSSELVRSAFESELSDFTGQDISVLGDIDVTLFPTPIAELTNVTIASATEGGDPFLEVDSIRANIGLLTLFTGKPQFTGLELVRPQLNLVRSPDGLVNWRDGFGRISAAADLARDALSKQSNAEQTMPLNATDILKDGFPRKLGSVLISDGSIKFKDSVGNPLFAATSLKGQINWPAFDAKLTVEGNGIVRGAPVSFSLQSDQPLLFLAEQTTQASINLKSENASIAYNGAVGLYSSLFADGDLSVDVQSVPAFLDLIDAEIKPGKAIKAVQISGPFALNDGKATFADLDIVVDGNAGKGVLEISPDRSKSPLIAGTLDFDSLNLTSFVGAFISLPDLNFNSEDEIDLEFISQIQTDLRISATKANFGEIALSNIAATAQIGANIANFDLGDAEVFGGHMQARLQLSSDYGVGNSGQLSVSAQNIDSVAAGNALTLPGILPSGTATFSFDAKAPLGSWAALQRTASGVTNLEVTGGAIKGFGISRLLNNKNTGQFFTLTGGDQTDERFEKLKVEASLADGIITIKNAVIDYAVGNVTLEGVAPFRSDGIALTATATSIDAPNEAKQFFIGGSWYRAFATPLVQVAPSAQ